MHDPRRQLVFTVGLTFLGAASALGAYLAATWGAPFARGAGATAETVAGCVIGLATLAACNLLVTRFYIPRGMRWYRREA